MKKVILAAFFLAGMAELFAYNPPYGGEDLYRLAHPELMSGAASAAGGPNFTIVPASITYNPLLLVCSVLILILAELFFITLIK